jgi:hypothetical protein
VKVKGEGFALSLWNPLPGMGEVFGKEVVV